MYPELDHYIGRLDGLIKQLKPAERKKLSQRIGVQLRQSNKLRIKENIQPNGNPMRHRKDPKTFLAGYRKLRDREKLPIGRVFIYDGPDMRRRNIGELREMVTLKTPETDKKYGGEYREHKGGGRYQRQNYDPSYVEGYAIGRNGSGGVSKFYKKFIYVPGDEMVSRLKQKMMFQKIHQFKFLKLKADSNGAAVGFMGGLVSYIAAAHQYGEDNRPERELLGFSPGDLQMIEEAVVNHLAAAEK